MGHGELGNLVQCSPAIPFFNFQCLHVHVSEGHGKSWKSNMLSENKKANQ